MRRTVRWGSMVLLALAIAGVLSMAGAQCPMRGDRPKAEPAAPPCAPAAMHAYAAPGAPAAPCHPGAPMPQMASGRRGPGAEGMMMRLGLRDDQQKAIAKIRGDAQTARRELMKEMMRLRNDLQGEFLKDIPDAAALRSLAQRMGEIRTQMQIQQLEQRLAIHQLLTPEQRDQLMLTGRGPRARMMGPGMGPGMPGCCEKGRMGAGHVCGKGCMGEGRPCGMGCIGMVPDDEQSWMGEGDEGGWGPEGSEGPPTYIFFGRDPGCCQGGPKAWKSCDRREGRGQKPHRAHRGGFPRCFPEGSNDD
jgi:Spy/CpxP family protein refolding chaperone